MTRIHTFHPDAIKRTGRTVQEWEQFRKGSEGLSRPDANQSDPPRIQYAKTITNSANPTYPVAPANKFLVQLGYMNYNSTTLTTETATFVPYAPSQNRIIYSEIGWIPKGLVCRVTKHRKGWFLASDLSVMRHIGKPASTISANSIGGSVVIWKNNLATAWTVTNIWHFGTSSIATTKWVLIEWFPDLGSTGSWLVTNVWC